jgi:transcriptional regulator with XRE-family HTH domain
MLQNHEALAQAVNKGAQNNRIDMHVGARIRMRRTLLGMSQERLGAELGVTFQQVQKYERGITRVGSSRLFELSKVLEVPVSFFFDEMKPAIEENASSEMTEAKEMSSLRGGVTPTERRETFRLVRAYSKITDPAIRKRIFELTKSISKVKDF